MNAQIDTIQKPRIKASLPKLVVRNANTADVPAIHALIKKAYATLGPSGQYSEAQLLGHQNHFRDGQFVAIYENTIVGYCATFRIGGDIALKPHDWVVVTGRGFASRHDPAGDWLYGMDVCVDPDFRGLRIGQRLYNERKKLCHHLRLKGIVFAGRMPNLNRRWNSVGSAEKYLEMVLAGRQRDPVIGFQIRNGFTPIGILHNYLPVDHESRGFATHMIWRNPQVPDEIVVADASAARGPQTVRVAAVQYQQRAVKSFEEFAHQVEYFVDVVADYKADFVLFPELFTLQLLSIDNQRIPASEAVAALTNYTERFKELMSRLSVSYNINIIAGSHPTREADGEVYNICYVCLRDGSVHPRRKVHPTPNERYWWNIKGGRDVDIVQTDCGPIGVSICYDCQFPEMTRYLIDQGALLLFVPFCTDSRQAYCRVRYCAQARAIENQCYVIMAGNVGNLPNVENMDIQYSQSSVLTPCDFPFARDGVAADTTPNVEMVAIADLRLDSLRAARQDGTVRNLKDRRFDLYSLTWGRL
ncbi:MAG: GNAT family N-acetyltransferase [Proteobacteria bacterium]|nr:GNAT family N-acetyltransferase [Pseudomonadota bacterium]